MAYLVWGKGVSGFAAFNLLKEKGYKVYIGDDKEEGDLWKDIWSEIDTIVLSPGIPPHHLLWQKAIQDDKEIIGETELAFRFYKGKNIIAVTGTDGKSTTVHLLHTLLGFEEGGNFGTPFSEIVLKNPDKDVILEVSSFQGKSLKTFRPNIGIFLNFSEDHLDWHPDLEDYLKSKQNIFKNQTQDDMLILNENSPVRDTPSKAKKVFFGPNSELYVKEDKICFKDICILEDISSLPLKGMHNMYNVAVASFVAFSMGIDNIKEKLVNFKGLPFRYQYVGSFDDVNIYNDSKSTTVNSMLSAIESTPAPIILIMGGIDKGGDFSKLKPYAYKIKHAFIFGRDKTIIKDQIEDFIAYTLVDNLEQAVLKAKSIAMPKDNILFSPACASFDMFENYKHRGEVFNELIRKHFKAL